MRMIAVSTVVAKNNNDATTVLTLETIADKFVFNTSHKWHLINITYEKNATSKPFLP